MDKPLVTISIITYNQEKYVREAVRGLLSQTYEPLEIVISDDHSTDRTWDIILEEVGAYRAAGGIHKNIVLNRNEKNLGIALHVQKKVSLSQGEFLVENGGDDISFPNRVERLVDVWLQSNKQYDAIYSGAVRIDADGKKLGPLPERYFSRCCLGAVAAYSRRLIDAFPPITIKGAAEDTVYAKRTGLLGGHRLFLKDILVQYRVGVGVSTAVQNWRRPNLRAHQMNQYSAEQGLIDLAFVKDKIQDDKYKILFEEFNQTIEVSKKHAALLNGETFAERLKAYGKVRYKPWFRPGGWFQLACLLPEKFGDPLLNLLLKVSNLMNR